MQKEGIFYTHKYFKICTREQPLHNVNLKNPIFIRATPCQKGLAAKCPRAQNSGVCFYKTELLAPGGQFVILGLFCCCQHFSSEMPIFIVRNSKVAVPEPAFMWTANRPVFWRNAVPLATVRHIYIYIYTYIYTVWFSKRFFCRISPPNSAEILENTVFCPNPISPTFLEIAKQHSLPPTAWPWLVQAWASPLLWLKVRPWKGSLHLCNLSW